MRPKHLMLVAVIASALGVAVAATYPDASTTASSCELVVDSEVCTWIVMERGAPRELGVTIPMTLIESMPTDVEMVWPPRELANISFPREARTALGFDHVALNWEAHGHPPMTFATPHFDFHFYTATETDVAAIDCAHESKPTDLPASYALPDLDVPGMGRFIGLCVPGMGMHAMPAAEVDDGEPFSASLLVGYYDAAPIFLEPMVSRERLLERSGFSLPVPAVPGLTESVKYPRSFTAEYDADAEHYRLVFRGFEVE